MKRRTKNLTSVFCGAVFALALIVGGSVVASELKEVPAAAASHGVKISADDFDDTSFVLSSSTADAGGLLYSFAGAESLSLAGKTGLAIRVKNLRPRNIKSINSAYIQRILPSYILPTIRRFHFFG